MRDVLVYICAMLTRGNIAKRTVMLILFCVCARCEDDEMCLHGIDTVLHVNGIYARSVCSFDHNLTHKVCLQFAMNFDRSTHFTLSQLKREQKQKKCLWIVFANIVHYKNRFDWLNNDGCEVDRMVRWRVENSARCEIPLNGRVMDGWMDGWTACWMVGSLRCNIVCFIQYLLSHYSVKKWNEIIMIGIMT